MVRPSRAVPRRTPASTGTAVLLPRRRPPDSPGSAHRRQRQQHLTLEESDRLSRIARLTTRAAETFGSRSEAVAWLREPGGALGGARPLDRLRSGEGARLAGGRWNRPGRAAVYAAESRALAILEALVHAHPRRLPPDLVLLTVAVPEHLRQETWSVADLPDGWQEIGADAALDRGDAWLKQTSAAVLRVPSVVVPQEYDVVLNPLHPGHAEIRITETLPFVFDPRLLALRTPHR